MERCEKIEQFELSIRRIEDEYVSIIDIFGLSKGRMKIIWTLCEKGRPCSQKEICDDWYENKQTVNSAAKKLEEEGYIEILPSPENLREKLLTLTEKGKAFAKTSVEKMIAAEKTAFSELSEEEQNAAIKINEKYYRNLKKEYDKIRGEFR